VRQSVRRAKTPGSRRHSLAVRADLAIGTLTRMEAGTTDPSWSSVRAIAEALGISLTVLGHLVEGDQR
jgi:predicted transcriptional regulator